MSSVPHKLDCKDYKRWLESESAARLLALQSSWLQHKIPDFSGSNLMYHGLSHDSDFLQVASIKHCFRMGLPWQQGIIAADAWMSSGEWPLQDCGVDAVIMQHSLDFTRRPQQMIREASRVISPNGYLVIIGFNPFSLWGAAQKLMPFSSTMPWVANTVSAERLSDWLKLLDFTILSHETMGHISPLTFLPRRFCHRVDSVLAGSPLMMGNCYMLVAQKTVAGMTLIKNKHWLLPERQFGWANSMPQKQSIKKESSSI
jgi:SAM-dependent methyltransferase